MNQNRQQALYELSSNGTLFDFMSKEQRFEVQDMIHADQSDDNHYIAKVLAVVDTIKEMPSLYLTVGTIDPVMQLRYQNGISIVWVQEKDKGTATSCQQNQAYGYADVDYVGIENLNGSFISIYELKQQGYWLDLSYVPMSYNAIVDIASKHVASSARHREKLAELPGSQSHL
ncbi:MAG: hypothetical protein ACTS9Y_00680 [Methylophilus sp.]|uniref:hypothetical protein n=1 Tax=Methylophilus sp. TaxID=29541 RepID=UPI003FA03A24